MLSDAVCGRDLRGEQYAFSLDYQGERYAFCSMKCRRAFEAAPKKYARPALARAVSRFVAFLKSAKREGGGRCC